MKLILTIGIILSIPAHLLAATLLFEDFESDHPQYITSIDEFTDGGGDYFLRTEGSNTKNEIFYLEAGTRIPSGSHYFAAQDIDGEGASLPVTLSFNGINISGFSRLSFSLFIAEDDDGSSAQDWDVDDYVTVTYRIDGGASHNLFAIENNGSAANQAPLVDTDFDKNGDGAEITSIFTQFSRPIAETGNLLDLIFTLSLNAGDEDIAFDNIMITGDLTPVPTASSLLFLGTGLAGWIMFRRRNTA